MTPAEQIEIPNIPEPVPVDAEQAKKAAERTERLRLRAEREAVERAERDRLKKIKKDAAEQVVLALGHLDDEMLEACKDAIDEIISDRDTASEWGIFDALGARVGDQITYVDSAVYGEETIRKAEITDINDHAEVPSYHDVETDGPYNPRVYRPTYIIKAVGRKKPLTIRPSRVRSITKTVNGTRRP